MTRFEGFAWLGGGDGGCGGGAGEHSEGSHLTSLHPQAMVAGEKYQTLTGRSPQRPVGGPPR